MFLGHLIFVYWTPSLIESLVVVDLSILLLITLHLCVASYEGAGLWQVDVDMMDVLITSLVEYLQLENAYNVFVLNPKRDVKRAKYGYR